MITRKIRRSTILSLAILACVLHGTPVRALESGTSDLDTRFSAKVAKERTRQGTLKQLDDRRNARDSRSSSSDLDSQCGSQNIGNVDTGGRIGSQPREIFVYAPNSFNVVTRGGCR
ncbi:MAG: hypothetical protein AB7G13_23435 [Lautropia sp.]